MPKDFSFPSRTPQQVSRQAVITQDDITHAAQQLEQRSSRLARLLNANPEQRERENAQQ